ncbi:MAG: hypothetical protein ACRDTV_17990 [Mycobacterium sp.]
MLIIALVLAVIGLAALVFAVVTSNEVVAWVCIAASVIGVVLLVVDALQERQRRQTATEPVADDGPQPYPEEGDADYPEDVSDAGDEGVGAAGEQVPVRSADSGSDDDEEPRA